jgi:hypothetical protein
MYVATFVVSIRQESNFKILLTIHLGARDALKSEGILLLYNKKIIRGFHSLTTKMETKPKDEKKRKVEIGTTDDNVLPSPKVQKLTKLQSPAQHESLKPTNANSSVNTEEPPLESWLKEDGDQCNIPFPPLFLVRAFY